MGQNSNELNTSEGVLQSHKCETYSQNNLNPESIQITKTVTKKDNNTITNGTNLENSSDGLNRTYSEININAIATDIIKNDQTMPAKVENKNIVDIDCYSSKNAKEQERIREWLQNLTKKLDFLYEQSPSELVLDDIIQKNTFRICDPYSVLLYQQAKEVKSIINDQTVDKIHGKCIVTLHNGDECEGNWRQGKRMGKGTIMGPSLEKLGISHIAGNYENGVLKGLGRLFMQDNSILEGWFQQGYLHGPAKVTCRNGNLAWVGWYSAGLATGTCWKSVQGDAWIVGKVDSNGRMTGDEIAFLYPDLSTALLGTWREGELVSAVPAVVDSSRLVDGVMELEFKKTEDPVYKRWISNKQDITCPPHQGDIYERSKVQVRVSQVEGAGEGLYAKVDMEPNIIVAYYNGLRLKPGEGSLNEDTGYAIFIDWARTWQEKQRNEHMDIPARYQSTLDYSATLGHKVNHSFDPNLVFDVAEHPCYGRVPALRTLREIKAGEELCAHYTMDMEDAYDWYREAWQIYSTGGRQMEMRHNVLEQDAASKNQMESGDNVLEHYNTKNNTSEHQIETADNVEASKEDAMDNTCNNVKEKETKGNIGEHLMERVDIIREIEINNKMNQYIVEGIENTTVTGPEIQEKEHILKEINNVGQNEMEMGQYKGENMVHEKENEELDIAKGKAI